MNPICKYIKTRYKDISYRNIKNIEGYYEIIKEENPANTLDNAIVLYYISQTVNDDFLDIQKINYGSSKLEAKYAEYHKYIPKQGDKNEVTESIKFRLAVNHLIEKGFPVEDAREKINYIIGNLIILKSAKIQIIQKILPLIAPIAQISQKIYSGTYEVFTSIT